ncbi:hypothetical protein HDU79_003453 [Rhizoclosmatium sp. JEL0117]|nr:hypothetical protein HDU79_003453 [Rhizoclosmatium sp. JEL0117]
MHLPSFLVLLSLALVASASRRYYRPPGLQRANATNGLPTATRFDFRQTFKRPFFFPVGSKTIPYFELVGDAFASDESVRLAGSTPFALGGIWAARPNPHPEWVANIKFKSGSAAAERGGKGLAFWYSKHKLEKGHVNGGTDEWTGLAVLFESSDSTKDRWTPQIFGLLNDGSKKVMAKDLADADVGSVGNCFRNYRNSPYPVHVRVSYIGKTLSVEMDNLMDGKSYSICFVAYDVSLPSGYYFGFTASNGMHLHDDHDIMSMEISEANPKIKVTEEEVLDEKLIQKIVEVDQMVDEIRAEEEVGQGASENAAVSSDVVLELRQSQIQILEALNSIQQRLTKIEASSSGTQQGSQNQHPSSNDPTIMSRILAPMDKKVAEMNNIINKLESEITTLNANIRGLYQELEKVESKGTVMMGGIAMAVSRSQQSIDKTHEVVQGQKHHYFTYIVLMLVGGVMAYVFSVAYRAWLRERMPKRYI